MSNMESSDWSSQIKQEVTNAIMQIESLPIPESDAVFSLLPGGEYGGMTAGDPALTSNDELVTILGYSSNYKSKNELLQSGQSQEEYDKLLKSLNISPEFTDPK